MRRTYVTTARLVLALGLGAGTASAWEAETCDGEIRGIWVNANFKINRCSIPAGSDREAALLYGLNAWNQIVGMHDRFTTSEGSSNCSIDHDDNQFDVAWVDPSAIDGLAGLAVQDDDPCVFPYPSWWDGDTTEASVMIASNLPLGLQSESSNNLGARETVIHEFGHVLGADHEDDEMSIMCASDTCGKVAGGCPLACAGPQQTESIFPDDKAFAERWHRSNGSAVDLVSSIWTFNNGPTRLQNAYPTLTRKRGETFTVQVAFGNIGITDVSTADGAKASVVLSTNTQITTLDTLAGLFNINSVADDQYTTQTLTIAVPQSVTCGTTYEVGFIMDSTEVLNETAERNNSVLARLRISVPSSC